MKKMDYLQGSEEWLEFRKTGIGASDIAAITGISPFKKAIDVYNEKLGIAPPQFVSNAMLRGTVFEVDARNKHNKVNNRNFQPIVVQHDDYEFFYASLDGYDEETQEVLEIKTPTNRDLLTFTAQGNMRDYYLVQVQWQLFITGAKTAIFAVYWPESEEMYEIIVERDEEHIERLKGAAVDFWVQLSSRTEPEDLTRHIDLEFPEHLDKFEEYSMYQRIAKEAADKMKELKPLLIDLGDDGNWCAHGIKFTFSEGKTSYDYKAMSDDGIDISKYRKIGKPFYKLGVVKD